MESSRQSSIPRLSAGSVRGLACPALVDERRTRTNKERLYRGDPDDTYYGILAQFREQAHTARRVFGVSCLVAINFGVCTLRRPATTHACRLTHERVRVGAAVTKAPREQRDTNFPP